MLSSFTGNDYKKAISYKICRKSYWIISPTADGNCGLYAFACALIDAITSNKLSLDPNLFSHFRNALLINLPHCELKELLKKPSTHFEQFRDFLHQEYSRNALKKLTHWFSNSLRQIGYDRYLELLKEEAKVDQLLDTTDQNLNQDRMYIGFEILVPLADYFKINLGLIAYNCSTQSYYWAHSPDNARPFFLLFNPKSHWNYLLPKKQIIGLSKFLPDPSISFWKQINKALKKNSIRLACQLNKLQTIIQHFKKNFHTNEVISNAYNETEQKNLTSLYENISLDDLIQIDETTLELLETVHHLNSKEFNLILEKLQLSEIEKALITKVYVIDNETDETAINLQNHVIFDFFKEHYPLKTKKTTLSWFFKCHSSSSETILTSNVKNYSR